MTQEEKAKAYDETVNKIRPLYEQAIKDGNPIWSTYKYLVPELCESEDEKIRKAIKCYVEDMPDTYGFAHGIGKKEMLSYLEKQKDAFENGRQLGIMQEQARQELGWPDEKQKELSELGKYIADKRSKVGFYCNHKEVSWNEIPLEDRKHDYPYYFDGDIDCYPFVVRKQKEQKPAEWSAEDERNYEYLHQVICCYINNPQIEYKERERASKKLIPFLERLKSLRPSWKPTKEQMRELKTSYSYWQGITAEIPNTKLLESLYNDLKKLM